MLSERSQTNAQRPLVPKYISFSFLKAPGTSLRRHHILHGVIILLAMLASLWGAVRFVVRFRVASRRLEATPASLSEVDGRAKADCLALQPQYLRNPLIISIYKLNASLRHRHILHGIVILLAVLAPLWGAARFRVASREFEIAPMSLPGVDGRAKAGYLLLQSQYLHSPTITDTYKLEVSSAEAIDSQGRTAAQLTAVSVPEEPKAQQEIKEYRVVDGDNVLAIAEYFGLSVDTVIWANDLGEGNYLKIDQVLRILPVDGVLHKVEEGDTLESIASKYKVAPNAIKGFEPNHIANPSDLQPGQSIIVPGGELETKWRPVPSSRGDSRYASAATPSYTPPKADTTFQWPASGPITQYFGSYHAGIDIAASYGSPIYAVASGKVIEAVKLDWSYGWYLTVDHGNGFQTLYAHCSRFHVGAGEYVNKGQVIASVGSTGKSTGPHLHFEIYRNGGVVNPLNYLP